MKEESAPKSVSLLGEVVRQVPAYPALLEKLSRGEPAGTVASAAGSLPATLLALLSGDLARPLADAVFFYIGEELDWDVELAIPAGEVKPVKLGQSGRLGWTTWVSPNWASTDEYRSDARFHLVDRLRGDAKP